MATETRAQMTPREILAEVAAAVEDARASSPDGATADDVAAVALGLLADGPLSDASDEVWTRMESIAYAYAALCEVRS